MNFSQNEFYIVFLLIRKLVCNLFIIHLSEIVFALVKTFLNSLRELWRTIKMARKISLFTFKYDNFSVNNITTPTYIRI